MADVLESSSEAGKLANSVSQEQRHREEQQNAGKRYQICTVRTSGPKPPFPSQYQSPIRPPINPNQAVRPPPPLQLQQQSSFDGQQQRPGPPPLRRVDSRGNILINQSRPPSGVQNQPIRSPTAQPSRPQGAPNWSNPPHAASPPQNRPPFPYGPPTQNIQGRPPFPRIPGQHPVTAPNQPPFRPPFPQQQPPQRQIAPAGGAPPNQSLQNQKMSQESNKKRSDSFMNDDDDVIIGPATTPQKVAQQPDPMSQSIYGSLDNRNTIKNDDASVKMSQNLTNFSEDAVKGKLVSNSYDDSPKDRQSQKIQGPQEPTTPKTPGEGQQRVGQGMDRPRVQKMASRGAINLTRKYGAEDAEMRQQKELASRPGSPTSKRAPPENINRMPSQDIMHQPQFEMKQDATRRVDSAKKVAERPKSRLYKGDNDSGVDESTQGNDRNGPESPGSPLKSPTKSGASRPSSATPSNKSNKSRSTSRQRLLLKTPEPEQSKKVPMNKIQVGHAPSPNLKAVKSKIGSLDNAAYKPGGGNVKIETKKVEIKAAPRIEAKNDKYVPKGGDKKIVSTKLQWNAKSKIGSLENAHHKPGGGDKKIETLKPDFKDKAKSKVGSKENVKHAPGGGDIKIQTHKIEIKAQSKVGSLDNVKHKPGGGDKKIFDDKEYLKNVDHPVALTPPSQSPIPPAMTTSQGADENLNQQQS